MGSKRFFYILCTYFLPGKKLEKVALFIEEEHGFPSFWDLKMHVHKEVKSLDGVVTVDYIYEFQDEGDYKQAISKDENLETHIQTKQQDS